LVPAAPLEAIVCNLLCAAILVNVSAFRILFKIQTIDLLKSIKLILPATVQLEAHLDASKDHFLSTLKVNSELHDIAIVDWERFAFLRRWAQANMIQKCAGRTLDVLDVPFSILVPELAVSATDDLTLETDGGG
jgi:hypothetical protein